LNAGGTIDGHQERTTMLYSDLRSWIGEVEKFGEL